MGVLLAAAIASMAKRAILEQWSALWSLCRLPTAINASPEAKPSEKEPGAEGRGSRVYCTDGLDLEDVVLVRERVEPGQFGT